MQVLDLMSSRDSYPPKDTGAIRLTGPAHSDPVFAVWGRTEKRTHARAVSSRPAPGKQRETRDVTASSIGWIVRSCMVYASATCIATLALYSQTARKSQ